MLFKKDTNTEPLKIIAKNGMELDPEQVFYVDGSLENTDSELPSVYSSLEMAIQEARNGTEEQPFRIYLEPGMYLLYGGAGEPGIRIPWDYLELIGLGEDPSAVVIADNRGIMAGCTTHSETVEIAGTHFTAKNLTLLNFCNCDYPYRYNPSLNQRMRTSALTRAHCIAAAEDRKPDDLTFIHVNFIGMEETVMLRSVPHVLFQNCTIQGTRDFIGGGDMHVFEHCTIECLDNYPVFCAGRDGTAFFDCTWKLGFKEPQHLYLAHHYSALFLKQCRFEDTNGTLQDIYWSQYPVPGIPCLYSALTKDGSPIRILPEHCGLELTDAQCENMTAAHLLGQSGAEPPEPIHIRISKSITITDGEQNCYIGASVFPPSANQNLTWNCKNTYLHLQVPTAEELAESKLSAPIFSEGRAAGSIVRLEGRNPTEHPVSVMVTAATVNGISAQCEVTIIPPVLESPRMIRQPQILIQDGTAVLDYKLETNGYPDESRIIWYYLNNSEKGNILAPIECSAPGTPCRIHRLTYGDAGKYLIATLEPKHSRSKAGRPVQITSSRRVTLKDVPGNGIGKYNYRTDFSTFPTDWNAESINGGWQIDAIQPADTPQTRLPSTELPWMYGIGVQGADRQAGLLTTGFGGRLLYRVELDRVKLMVQQTGFDSTFALVINPERTDGTGFEGADGQYLDLFIKFDIDTQTGYGLRISRTTAYSNAASFTLCQYHNGIATQLTAPCYAAAFTSPCRIILKTRDQMLFAQITSKAKPTGEQTEQGLPMEIALSTAIEENYYYSMGLLYTGKIEEGSRLQLRKLKITYEGRNKS